MSRSPLRDRLVGVSTDNDRLWLLHSPDGITCAITEYNDELTGYDPDLGAAFPDVFQYGGNAYYIKGPWARANGFMVEAFEDRR